jgi:hypothetical protein
MKVHTNNVPREIIYAHELSAEDRAEFDYLDWEAIERGEDTRDFFRYKGELYDLADFMTTAPGPFNYGLPKEFNDWDGYQSDSFFSGILVRYARDESGNLDADFVVVGWYNS